MSRSERRWRIFLLAAAVAGLALRLIWTADMEFKEDEWFDYIQTGLVGRTQPWPWSGMPSGVYIRNPGMSVWVFVALARLFGVSTPTGLERALAFTGWLGIAALYPFARYLLRGPTARREREREIWHWAMALAFVNPFLVYLHRKLWPEPFFTVFTLAALAGWWRRERALGACVWGFVGALLGQIHMSGFFFALGLVLATAASELRPRRNSSDAAREPATAWRSWLLGSGLGALPLVPWAREVLTVPAGGPVTVGWWENVSQFKFWVFWCTDSLGLHLGNPLGLLRGQSTWAQLSDFVRYPLVSGHATYLNALAHLVLVGAGGWILLGAAARGLRRLRRVRVGAGAATPPTALAERSALYGFGPLMTLTGVNIRRYYMAVSFPLELTWLAARALNRGHRAGRRALAALWVAQLVVSACFVLYVHENRGAPQGDYGDAYWVTVRDSLLRTGKPWPDYDASYAPDYEGKLGADELRSRDARTAPPGAR